MSAQAKTPAKVQDESDDFPGMSNKVVDIVNRSQFVDRVTFDQTLRETQVQWSIGDDRYAAHYGMRDGFPIILYDVPGATLLPLYFPEGLCSPENLADIDNFDD